MLSSSVITLRTSLNTKGIINTLVQSIVIFSE